MEECLFVDSARLAGVLKESLDLRGKGDPSVVQAVVQRLNANAIADQPKPASRRVPEGDGEHATKFLQAGDAPGGKGLQNHFGIRVVRFPAAVAEFLQLAADFSVVVDLAVEHHLEGAVGVAHGLRGRVGQIDDGEAAMGQPDAAVGGDPKAGAVGAAVDHRLPQAEKVVRVYLKIAVFECQYAGNAAHALTPVQAGTSLIDPSRSKGQG